MRFTLSIFCGILATTTAAYSADEVEIDTARFAWEGSYLGLQIGYVDADSDFRDPIFPQPNPTQGTASDEGVSAGVFIGHNWLAENILFGVEADIAKTNVDAIGEAPFGFPVFGRAEIDWQASVRARVGITQDNFLVYATGGLSVASVDFDFAFPGPLFGFGDQFSETLIGYTVGGGIEVALSESITAKVEYRYSDYDDAESTITNCCAPPPNFQRHELTTNSVNFGISKKLN